MGDINKMIQWMKDREGKVVYEQVRPWGTGTPPRYDCSVAVISALRAGGFWTIAEEITEIQKHYMD